MARIARYAGLFTHLILSFMLLSSLALVLSVPIQTQNSTKASPFRGLGDFGFNITQDQNQDDESEGDEPNQPATGQEIHPFEMAVQFPPANHPDRDFWVKFSQLPRPHSCVSHCSHRTRPRFHLASGKTCSTTGAVCRFDRYSLTNYRRDRFVVAQHETEPVCLTDHLVECPMPTSVSCQGQCWNEWQVALKHGTEWFYHHFYDLLILPERPFEIKSIFLHPSDPKVVRVISYFLPNMPREDKCNQLYCVWYNENEGVQVTEAKHIDATMTDCPLPGYGPTDTVLRLTYDHILLSLPFKYQITQVSTEPRVPLSICAIVKREGINLPVWIEYHRIVGVKRFILYDNNPDNEPDNEMNAYLETQRRYNEKNNRKSDIVLLKWPFQHAQTDALTDCITRFGRTTKWMSLIDVDEFLVPARKYTSIEDIIESNFAEKRYLHSDWLTFGPCGFKKDAVGKTVMEACSKVTLSSSRNPKAMIQPRYIASMQGYGPHYVRMKRDVGIRPRSVSTYVNDYFLTYHYRYRTWEEYVDRRKGGAAGRVLVWDENRLNEQWAKGEKFNEPLAQEDNNILRFVPEIKERLRQYAEEA